MKQAFAWRRYRRVGLGDLQLVRLKPLDLGFVLSVILGAPVATTELRAHAQAQEARAPQRSSQRSPTPTTAAQTDNQYEVVHPYEVGGTRQRRPLPVPDEDGRFPVEVRGAFGQGLRFGRRSDDFSVQLRARVQLQSSFEHRADGDAVLGARVRRMRLVLGGHALHHWLTYYLQLGFAGPDLEVGNRVPLRDAFVTFHLHRDANLRLGQMKVPFDRQRITSSSKLQFVDRAALVRALNLDRDAGLQLYATDLFGLGEKLSYQLGIFGGEGRNRAPTDTGLLYVARLQWTPFGAFDDLREADFQGTGHRLAMAFAAAYNHRAQRLASTQGDFFVASPTSTSTDSAPLDPTPLDPTPLDPAPPGSETPLADGQGDELRRDFVHLTADLLYKVAGFSLLLEYLHRNARAGTVASSALATDSAWGVLAQGGYLYRRRWELALRAAHTRPLGRSTLAQNTALATVFSWYFLAHDLKLQTDYTATLGPGRHHAHLLRTQLQLFF